MKHVWYSDSNDEMRWIDLTSNENQWEGLILRSTDNDNDNSNDNKDTSNSETKNNMHTENNNHSLIEMIYRSL